MLSFIAALRFFASTSGDEAVGCFEALSGMISEDEVFLPLQISITFAKSHTVVAIDICSEYGDRRYWKRSTDD